MSTSSSPTFRLVFPVVLTLFILTGCRSVPVEITSVDGPDRLLTNEAGTFSVTTNAEAKQPVELAWSFGDNTTASGSTATHAYSQSGSYTVTVRATNRKGKSTDQEQLSVVVNVPPVPAQIVSATASNMNPDTRTAVRFTSSARGDAPISYSWNFGDGNTASQASPSHTFAQPGTYTVTLNVSNAAGNDSRSLSINVSRYEAPICRSISEMSAAFFERNSSVLTDAAAAALQENLEILRECPNLRARVEGMAAPGERNAQQLSADRARAVEQFYTQGGIAASRLSTMGLGRVAGVSTKEGASQFRRVDTIPVR